MLKLSTQINLFSLYCDSNKRVLYEGIQNNQLFDSYRKDVENKKADVYVAFIDIFQFSKKIQGKDVEYVKNFLSVYYKYIIPIVEKYHGQIDKIMGDGIIVVFSNVFGHNYTNGVGNACLNFCKECVESLEKTMYSSKAAIASGEMYFCKTGVEQSYEEYSCIGHPLTIVHRLENEASENEIWLLSSDPLNAEFVVTDYWMPHSEYVCLKGLDVSEATVYQFCSIVGDAAWLNKR